MKRAMITGANSEIGQAIAQKFYSNNWELLLCDQESEYDELIRKNADWKNTDFLQMNLEDDVSVDNAAQYIEKDGKSIDLLINVAGFNILKSFMEWERREVENMVKVNAINTLFLTQAVARKMITQKRGNIVFIGSQHGVVANFDRVPYSLSKAMLIQMTKSLALELAPFGIRVNCVSPTYVLTNKNKKILNSALFKIEALSEIPMKRYATSGEVANSIYFMGTENSDMITGHNLMIDGGWTIK